MICYCTGAWTGSIEFAERPITGDYLCPPGQYSELLVVRTTWRTGYPSNPHGWLGYSSPTGFLELMLEYPA